MKISKEALKELLELSNSDSLRKDMETIASQRHNPFIKDGRVDVDAYIEFVTQFNEFINHRPNPFKPMIDRVIGIKKEFLKGLKDTVVRIPLTQAVIYGWYDNEMGSYVNMLGELTVSIAEG